MQIHVVKYESGVKLERSSLAEAQALVEQTTEPATVESYERQYRIEGDAEDKVFDTPEEAETYRAELVNAFKVVNVDSPFQSEPIE